MIAKHLLEELPEQVLDYYKAMRIQPNEAAPPPVYEEPSHDEQLMPAETAAGLEAFPDMRVAMPPPPPLQPGLPQPGSR
jgi:hypothetical protein